MRFVKEIKWENCYKIYCYDEFGVFYKDLSGVKKKYEAIVYFGRVISILVINIWLLW